MIIKGFFFDLDGTLVDTHESNFLAYKDAAEKVKTVTLGEDLRILIKSGENSNSFLPKLIPGIIESEIKEINYIKKTIYPEYLSKSRLNRYLTGFLSQMSEHYTTVLVTTAKKENALAVLKNHGIENLFSIMIFGEDVENMKPHPDSYNLALKKSGLKSDEVIAFEDSCKGIASAEAAGIKVIHVKDFI